MIISMNVGRIGFFAVFSIFFLAAGFLRANTIKSPPFETYSLGAESERYRWKKYPHVSGGYDEDKSSYPLSGNGHGVYWCRDGAATARLSGTPLTGDFTFTARLKEVDIPEGIGQVGILVKGRWGTREPVISLRWDTYWAGRDKGLTWFNRITPTKDMEDMVTAYSEKMCHGTGQGCIGKGYENALGGYDSPEGLWFRVQRKNEGGLDKYFLFARKSENEPWEEIPSVTSTHNPCGAAQTPLEQPLNLPSFLMPETTEGRVHVGLFVAHGSFGQKSVSATFDNISITADDYKPEAPVIAAFIGNKSI